MVSIPSFWITPRTISWSFPRVGSQLSYQNISGEAEADRIGEDDGPLGLQNAEGRPKGEADNRERIHSTRDRGCIAGPDDFPDLWHETDYRA